MAILNTLTLRLVVTSGLWTIVTLAMTGILLTLLFRAHIERRFDALLIDHLEENIAASDIGVSGQLELTWTPSDPRFARPLSGWYWVIIGEDEPVAQSASLWREALAITPAVPGAGVQMQEFIGPGGARLRAAVQDITLPESDAHFSFAVAGPVGDIDRDVRTFTQSLTVTLVALGFGLLGAMLVQIRYGLRPLRALRYALVRVRAGEEARLPESFPAEVQPVVSELNALLDHNAALVERARTQTGNLAHALKNPLTVIINEARALPEGGDVIAEQAGVMRSHIERYLSRARAAGSPAVLGARTAVAPIADDLHFSMDQLYRDRPLQIELEGMDTLYFRGDAGDLEEMLGNLLDNACKWARSRVTVHGRVTDDRLLITVEDDGPGIAEGERANVLERGKRLDEATPGSGLGLDIVRDIAALYRGSLVLDASALGGVQARLELPAVQ